MALKDPRCGGKERRGGFGALRCQIVFKLFLGSLAVRYKLLHFIPLPQDEVITIIVVH